MDLSDRKYWIWLASIDGVGPMCFKKLMNAYDDPAEVFRQVEQGKAISLVTGPTYDNMVAACSAETVETQLRELEEKKICVVCQCDDIYPELLLNIYDPPFVLYGLGDMSLLKGKRMISMVGTRHPTRYGEQAATMLSRELSENGVTIVSGMASGIDGISHRGCLEGGGKTIAVLGCGVDIVYPRENQSLYDEIIEKGLVLSEYKPETPPVASNFPARNRIISGLSSGTIVVEAGQRSGTLFTVDYALDQGRDLFAVPGNINSTMSLTPNTLIKSGCHPVTSAADILEFYGWVRKSEKSGDIPRIKPASREEATVVELLEDGELTFDQLFEVTDFTVPQLASILSVMELKGMIVQLPGRVYSL